MWDKLQIVFVKCPGHIKEDTNMCVGWLGVGLCVYEWVVRWVCNFHYLSKDTHISNCYRVNIIRFIH